MANPEALAWARQIFGEPGPHVREVVPSLVTATHATYVALQQQTGLVNASPYGLIWLGMPKAFVDRLIRVAGVQLYRPKRGKYQLPVVNGVPVIPWRYAHDGKTDLKTVPFGQPLTESRRSLFTLPDLVAELPLGEVGLGDAVVGELEADDRAAMDQYAAGIRALATDGVVAVAAYASNPDALLDAYFGYATLGSGNLLEWTYVEPLELSPAGRLREVGAPGTVGAFDSGPLQQPKLRPRTPIEPQGPSGNDAPPPGATGTHE